MQGENSADYPYHSSQATWNNDYILDCIVKVLLEACPRPKKIFEVGCGNGYTAAVLHDLEYEVTGVDVSPSGVKQANIEHPQLKIFEGSIYDNLAATYGTFPVVLSLEVIEHCYDPRKFCQTLRSLMCDNGIAIISTPYHGYFKNLGLAVSGKLDAHFTVLWEGGHIKFFSIATLRRLFLEEGFTVEKIYRLGRIPVFAKSMLAVVRKVVA